MAHHLGRKKLLSELIMMITSNMMNMAIMLMTLPKVLHNGPRRAVGVLFTSAGVQHDKCPRFSAKPHLSFGGGFFMDNICWGGGH